MFKDGYSNQIQQELKAIREKGELKPVPFGFRSWNDYDTGHFLQASRGSYIMIGGEPHHGKTYVTNELICQMMEKHNFKVALFSSESGSVAKVFSTFYGMYMGKPYSKVRPDLKPNNYAMTDDERDIAEAFINARLRVFEQDRKKDNYQTIENIYKMVEECERIEDIKFDSVVIDPIYDVDDFEPKANEVKRVLSYIDYQCEINNRVDIVVNHVAETQKFTNKEGKRFKLRALGDEFYGGKNNQRKAKLQLLVERAIPNLTPDDSADFVPENQTNVIVLKAKPEGVANMGVYPIFYDWKKRRFYEELNGDTHYADCTRFYGEFTPEVKKEIPYATVEDAFETSITSENFPKDERDEFPF